MGFGVFAVLSYLFSLEEAGAGWSGGMGTCPSPQPMTAGSGRSQLPGTARAPWGWLPRGTQQVTMAEVAEAA